MPFSLTRPPALSFPPTRPLLPAQFERTVGGAADGRTRAYDVALRRERFYLHEEDEEEGDGFDDDDDASLFSEGGGLRKRKADYWEGYRAAMSHKAPPFATSIASFETDDDDDDDADRFSDAPSLPPLPESPDASDADDDPTGTEPTTEAHLAGALAAGAVVGLPTPSQLHPLPTLDDIDRHAKEHADAEKEAMATLAPISHEWAKRLSGWDRTLRRDLEGMRVKQEVRYFQ